MTLLLHAASKTQLQIDGQGVLLLQHLIRGTGGNNAVVDFVFVPSMGPDDSDEEAVNMDLEED